MFDTGLVLSVIAGLLVLVCFCQPLAARLGLPQSVVLAAVGVGIGAFPAIASLLGSDSSFNAAADLFTGLPMTSGTFIYVFLPLLVFEAGIVTDVRRSIEDGAAILVLAVMATVIAMGVIGFALWPFARMPLTVCLLLGAIVSTTDPAAVIAVFRDVGAPARLTRLVEGEALLNDAAAIALFVVLLNMILAGGQPDIVVGLADFAVAFIGGGVVGYFAGRLLLTILPWLGDDRLSEGTLSVAFAYLSFIAAERVFHMSGVVAVLAAGLTLSARGRSRVSPENWSFLVDLWEQLAYWARSLIFVLASIRVPRFLLEAGWHDLVLLAVLIAAAFGARVFALFCLVPPLEYLGLTPRIEAPYKIAITWGGLRGALTLVLALGVTENSAIPHEIQRFVAVVATGFVLVTLFINGTTLRAVIGLLGLDRLSPRDEALRDRILVLSYAEAQDAAREIAEVHGISRATLERVIAPYRENMARLDREEAEIKHLTERDRLAVALVSLANQERGLALQTLRDRIASPGAVQTLLGNADHLADGARATGRRGYQRAGEASLALTFGFRFAYVVYRRLRLIRPLADRLAERVELLLIMRLIVDRVIGFNDQQIARLFGPRIAELTHEIVAQRREAVVGAVDALRRQYPDYLAELEARFLRQATLRHEITRYDSLYEEGLISREIHDDLKRGVLGARAAEPQPHFDIGLDTHKLVKQLDILASLDEPQFDRVCRLLRPGFAVPGEAIFRRGERGDAVYFIASGAVEVRLPGKPMRLGSGEFFGELALLSGQPRQADVVALTYCRFLVLRQLDFEHFMSANPEARATINRVAEARRKGNAGDASAS